MPTEIAEIVGGGVLAVLGPVLWASATTEPVCGRIAGCFDRMSAAGTTRREAGTSLLGMGIGLAATGGLSLAITQAVPLAPGKERRAPAGATTGHVLTSLGIGLVGGGLAFGAAADRRGADYGRAWPFFVTGGVLAAVGIPILAVKAREQDQTETRARELRKEHTRRDTPAVLSPTLVRVGLGSLSVEWVL